MEHKDTKTKKTDSTLNPIRTPSLSREGTGWVSPSLSREGRGGSLPFLHRFRWAEAGLPLGASKASDEWKRRTGLISRRKALKGSISRIKSP